MIGGGLILMQQHGFPSVGRVLPNLAAENSDCEQAAGGVGFPAIGRTVTGGDNLGSLARMRPSGSTKVPLGCSISGESPTASVAVPLSRASGFRDSYPPPKGAPRELRDRGWC